MDATWWGVSYPSLSNGWTPTLLKALLFHSYGAYDPWKLSGNRTQLGYDRLPNSVI